MPENAGSQEGAGPAAGTAGTGPIAEPPLIHRVELTISYILRLGVLVSIALVVLGMCLTFAHHPDYVTRAVPVREVPKLAASFPKTLAETWASLRELRGQGFVILGLLVLLVTPVIRVAVSIFAFGIQRDWKFTCITTLVLVILLVSFFLGKTEGG
jgi:uncharacterized membrane protein